MKGDRITVIYAFGDKSAEFHMDATRDGAKVEFDRDRTGVVKVIEENKVGAILREAQFAGSAVIAVIRGRAPVTAKRARKVKAAAEPTE